MYRRINVFGQTFDWNIKPFHNTHEISRCKHWPLCCGFVWSFKISVKKHVPPYLFILLFKNIKVTMELSTEEVCLNINSIKSVNILYTGFLTYVDQGSWEDYCLDMLTVGICINTYLRKNVEAMVKLHKSWLLNLFIGTEYIPCFTEVLVARMVSNNVCRLVCFVRLEIALCQVLCK
jgi:hypothetical protein